MSLIVESPIRKCPVCNYPLTGLPPAHRCPECGFEYDETTVVFRLRKPWKLYVLLIPMAAALLINGWGFFFLPGDHWQPGWSRSIRVTCLLLMVTGGVYGLARTWQGNRRGRFIAVSRRSIAVRNYKDAEPIAWDNLAHINLTTTPPWLRRREPEKKISLQGLVRTAADRYALRRAIMAARPPDPDLKPIYELIT